MWRFLVIAVVALGLLLGGSYLYWRGEGSPGTPAQFRQAVRDTGLAVAWDNSGPSAGSGQVATRCGEVTVDISLRDRRLEVRWLTEIAELTPTTAAAITNCDLP